jgi:nucleotide-binding universal stress UspA family protein
LVQACKLAACVHAGVTLLHVVHDPAEMPGYYARIAKKKHMVRIQDSAAEMLKDFLADVAKSHHQVADARHLESMLVVGLPVNRILEVAEKIEAEMIVMGSRGTSGLKHLMIGSKVEQLIRLSPIPVTIVKSREMVEQAEGQG